MCLAGKKIWRRKNEGLGWRPGPMLPSQSNGKLERWHGNLKRECVRPGTPLCVEDARPLVAARPNQPRIIPPNVTEGETRQASSIPSLTLLPVTAQARKFRFTLNQNNPVYP
jgi:hypothetical protein